MRKFLGLLSNYSRLWRLCFSIMFLCLLFGTSCENYSPPTSHSTTLVTPTTVGQIRPEGTSILTYYGHSSLINTLAWSLDGNMLASAGDDETVQVWNAGSGKHIATYHGHDDYVENISWSPDSQYIASTQQDGDTVEVWNALTGQPAFSLHSDDGASVVAWSPDGKYLVAGQDTLYVWDIVTKKIIATYKSHTSYVTSLAWSPDGKLIASASDDHTVQVWNPITGAALFTFHGHSQKVNAVAWSPDGKRLVSGSQDGTAQVWDATTGKHVLIHRITGSGVYGIRAVSWAPDGSQIATSDDGEPTAIQLWNATSDKLNYTRAADANTLAWSPDGSRIASDDSHNVEIWQVGKSTNLVVSAVPMPSPTSITSGPGKLSASFRIDSSGKAVSWSSNGRLLAVIGKNGQVTVWDISTQKVVETLNGSLYDSQGAFVAWSPNGKLLAIPSQDSTTIWDVATQKQIGSCSPGGTFGSVNAASWSPDGKQLALVGSEMEMVICDVATGKQLRTYQQESSTSTQGFESVAWSPDGKLIAVGSSDSSLYLLNAATATAVKSYIGSVLIYALAWSPNSYYLALGGYQSGVAIIHPGDAGSDAISFDGQSSSTVTSLSWSLDGKRVASSTLSGLVQIGDMGTRKNVYSYTQHYTSVFGAAWSPDGSHIASTDNDGNVEIWQTT